MKPNFVFITGVGMAFPFFITKNLEVFKGGVENYVFSLPISLISCAVVLICGSNYGVRALKYKEPLLFLTSLLLIAILSLFVERGQDPSLLALYLVCAVIGFFWPWCLSVQNDLKINTFFKGFAYSISIAAFLHIMDSFVVLGVGKTFQARGVDCIFGIFSIYQKCIYYSTLLAIACFLVIRHLDGFKKYLILSVLFTDILIIGAREALVLVYFLFFCYIVEKKDSLNEKIIYGCLLLLIMTLFSMMFYWLGQSYFPNAIVVAKLGTLAQLDKHPDLSAGRADAIYHVVSSFKIDSFFLLLGSHFSMLIGRLDTPHNQYIEWFLRGGLLFVSFNLYFLIYATFNMLRSASYPLVTAGYILLSVILISNNINTPFRAPYMSLFMWTLIGISFCVMCSGRKNSLSNIKNSIVKFDRMRFLTRRLAKALQ